MKRKSNRVTSYEVAKLAGVSQPTVSRAFTPGSYIAEEKRERVLAAAKQLNYIPNSIASSLANDRSKIIAVIVGDLANPFYAEALQTFISQLQATGQQALTFSIRESGDTDYALTQALRYHVDGIVVTSARLSTNLVAMSEGAGIPITLFNRSTEDRTLLSVRCDNFAGAQILGKAIYGAGARSVIIVRGDLAGSTNRDRVAGFRHAIQEAARDAVRIDEIDGNSSYQGAYAALHARLLDRSLPRPEAIYAVNDVMAIACIDVIRQAFGLAVPEDIMVAGFDGTREGQFASYQLTTIRQPIDDMVRKTLDLLESAENTPGPAKVGPAKGESFVLPGTFLPGKTVPLSH